MKVGVKSLNSYLEKPISTEDMVTALERSEVEVEEILYANKLDPKVIVVEITKVEPHPNADRLKLVTVDMGNGGSQKLVCGGANARVGVFTAFAQVGTILPDGIEIKDAEIRGVKSAGMLCTERELGLSDNHDGIVELDPATPVGKSLCDIAEIGDSLDITTPTNRWDYLSIVGLAREISAFTDNNSLVEPDIAKNEYQDREVAKVKKKGGCKRFISVKCVVKNNANSPRWLVDNLEANGMSSISPVVDITNWVMLELGQPSHAFAADKISGDLQVRYASPAEKLKLLNGKEVEFTAEDLVIADSDGPLDLAGVMGGQKAEVKPNTTEIILTIANFDKTTVRRAALRHGVRTEASARFERGLPLPLPILAADRLIGLLKEICQAEIVDSPVDQLFGEFKPSQIGMSLRKAESTLGMDIDEGKVSTGLKKRGFEVSHFSLTQSFREAKASGVKDSSELLNAVFGGIASKNKWDEVGEKIEVDKHRAGDILWLGNNIAVCQGNNTALTVKEGKVAEVKIVKVNKAKRLMPSYNHILVVKVPWWRPDISIAEDLYEEVAKIVGYDNMPSTLPALPPMDTHEFQIWPRLMNLKHTLVAAGCMEIMTYSLVSAEMSELSGSDLSSQVEIVNPMVKEQAYLRSSLLASHLKAIGANRGNAVLDVFEISKVVQLPQAEKSVKPAESWHLGISCIGANSLARLKACLDMLVGEYHLEIEVKASKAPGFVDGRSAEAYVNNELVAEFGQVKPSILKNFGLSLETSFAEIKVEKMFEFERNPEPKALPPYQYVVRDLTVEVAELVTWQLISQTVKKAENVVSVSFKNSYQNDQLKQAGRKNLSFSIEFDLGPQPKTQAIDTCLNQVIDELKSHPELKDIAQR